MRKFIITFLLILCSISIAKATDWKEIENSLYYDTETIEYTEDGVRFWFKNYVENGYVKELVYINLAEKKITTEQTYLYDKKDVLISYSKSKNTERIIPDSISELLYHYFSNNRNLTNNNFFENGTTKISGVDFSPYMRDLQRRIKYNWHPPKGNENRKVVLLFKISKNGQLLTCRVYKSSGLPSVDQAALNAVKMTAPFKPLPAEYKDSSADIQFTFGKN